MQRVGMTVASYGTDTLASRVLTGYYFDSDFQHLLVKCFCYCCCSFLVESKLLTVCALFVF